jgi:hypothetical protein
VSKSSDLLPKYLSIRCLLIPAASEIRSTPAPAPSVHVRAAVTWLAIFPLVAVGLAVLGPVAEDWNPVLRALVLTLVIVPSAVYVVVPALLSLYGRIARRGGRPTGGRGLVRLPQRRA